MLLRTLLLLSLAVLPAASASAAAHWPQFLGPRGDSHATGETAPLEWTEEQNVVWKTDIHGRGWSSPVVWGDQIWFTTATEDGKKMYAVCVDFNSGSILHDILLFENESPSEIHVFNSYASPTPAIEEGRVYIHFGSYGTACLDSASGETLWQRRDLPCEHHRGPGSSPILFENLLIIHYDGFDFQYVVALDKSSGSTVWKTDRTVDYGTDDGDIMKAYSTPSVIDVDGQLQLVSPTSKAVLAYDPRTGQEIWRVRHDQFSGACRPQFAHGLVYVTTGYNKSELLAIRPNGQGDVTDQNVAWRVTKSIGSKPSPIVVDDLIYQVNDAGVATCNDAKTGEERWSKRLGGNYSASPIYAGGHLYFCSETGQTTVVKPGPKFKEVAVNQIGDPALESSGFLATPAAVGNSLLLRTRTQLYRIEHKQ